MVSIISKPLLPLRDIVVFPSMVVPLFVGREKSIKALQEVMKTDKSIVLVSQKNSEIDEPENKDIYGYGCLSKVLQLLKLPDGTVKVLVEGEKRVKIHEIRKEEPAFLSCSIEFVEDTNKTKESDLYALSLIKKY
jgi:ATP-dependent Lon protease